MRATAAVQFAARDLALDELAIDTIAVLSHAAIDVLLVKGPVTSRCLYGDQLSRRHYSDVDLLVSPTDFDRAERALEGAGYRRKDEGVRASERLWRERSWQSPASGLSVDLHRSLAYVDRPTELWSRLWRDRTELALSAGSAPTPDLVGMALVLGLHAARPGGSAQPGSDLARAVEVFDDAQWGAAIELARQTGALTGLVLGLDAVAAARPLIPAFGLSAGTSTFVRMHAPGLSPAGLSIARLMELDNRWDRLVHVVGRVFPSTAQMRHGWPMARRGPVGLSVCYLRRWLRFSRSVPRALAELHHARRYDDRVGDAWTDEAVATVKRQLSDGDLHQVELAAPGADVTSAAVDARLDRLGASCLERSLVRQRLHAARGRPLDLVIGVSAPGERFHAHAWLQGDRQGDESLRQIVVRRAAPLDRPPPSS